MYKSKAKASSAPKSKRQLASIRAARVKARSSLLSKNIAASRQGKAMMINLAALYDNAFGGRNREYFAHGAIVSTCSDTGGGSHLFEIECPHQADLVVALLNFAARLNGSSPI